MRENATVTPDRVGRFIQTTYDPGLAIGSFPADLPNVEAQLFNCDFIS